MARRYKLVSDDALKALSGLVGLVRLRLKGRSARKHSKKTSAPLGRRLPQIRRDHSKLSRRWGVTLESGSRRRFAKRSLQTTLVPAIAPGTAITHIVLQC